MARPGRLEGGEIAVKGNRNFYTKPGPFKQEKKTTSSLSPEKKKNLLLRGILISSRR